MILSGLARLGRDAELRFLPDGTAVVQLALAFNYGKKHHEDGSRSTQWLDASLFGKRAEALAPYLQKGGQVSAVIDAPHIETYAKKDGGEGFKLTGRVLDIELAGGKREATDPQSPSPPRASNPSAPTKPAPARDNFDNFDDDIPF